MQDEKATLPVENEKGFDTPVAGLAPGADPAEETLFDDEEDEDSDDADEDSEDE